MQNDCTNLHNLTFFALQSPPPGGECIRRDVAAMLGEEPDRAFVVLDSLENAESYPVCVLNLIRGNMHGQMMRPNAPIGLWPEVEYVGESVEFFKDRLLFLYTDGLNEAEDPEQHQFGDERLLDVLRQTQFNSAKQVIEAMTREVERHRNGAEPNDDLTMMCMKLT